MKSRTFKRTALAAALIASSGIASASSYFVVVPLPAKAAASAIAVALSPSALPAGLAGSRYPDFNFRGVLTVTGDPDFNPAYVRWSIVSGALPAGLTLTAAGALTGTPAVDGQATFELKAYYKSKEGVQRYVLTITERGSVATLYGVGTLDWGTVDRAQLPQVRSIAISNTGDRPMSLSAARSAGPFELVGNTCTSVAPGGTCSLAYRFNDTVPGDYGPAVASIGGATSGATSIRLAGRVMGPLVAADTGTSLDFGNVTQSDSAGSRTVTWRNKGNAPMSLVAGATVAPFSLASNTCLAVAPGATCQTTFSIDTANAGAYASTVSFTGGGAAAAATLAAKVAAYNLSASLSAISFGNVPAGTSASRTVTVTNNGAVRAPLSVAALSAPFRQSTTCGAALEAGASCDVTVTYSPTDLTSKATTLALPGLAIPVNGTGDKVSIETAGAGRRWQDGTYAASCNGYLSAGGNYRYAGATGSGVYTVDPDGAGPQPTVDVYCDMVTDGGGWTLASNYGRNGTVDTSLMAAGGDYNVARSPASPVGVSGDVGISRWGNSFGFSMARLDIIAGDDTSQVATFYKTVTYANMASWGVFAAVEPNDTRTCTDLSLTQNCTTQPFDHNYFGTQTGLIIMRGVNLAEYGYPASSDIPMHGTFDSTSGGYCSVTGNNNNNQWHDSYSDGHWGNGLRIWLR